MVVNPRPARASAGGVCRHAIHRGYLRAEAIHEPIWCNDLWTVKTSGALGLKLAWLRRGRMRKESTGK